MGQEDILDILEQERKPLSVKEISLLLKDDCSKISKHVKKLVKHCEIKCIEVDRETALKNYHCKRRMRIYYVE